MIGKWKDEAQILPTIKLSPSFSLSYPNGFSLVYKRSANYVWCPESLCMVVKKNEMDPKLSIVVTRSRKNADQNRTEFCEEYEASKVANNPEVLPNLELLNNEFLLRSNKHVRNEMPNENLKPN